MTLLNSNRLFSKDINRIRSISLKIDQKLSEIKCSDESKIDKLSFEELQDLDKIVGIADFMLCKYADKKDMSSILKYFVSIISVLKAAKTSGSYQDSWRFISSRA